MKNVMTQGAILNNVKSNKYPGVKCKGIVITPRCDIANEKVANVYYLTAVTIEEWINCIWIKKKLIEKEKNDRGNIRSIITEYKLDLDVLISFDKGEAREHVLNDKITDENKRIKVKNYLEFKNYVDVVYNSELNHSEIINIMEKCKIKNKELSKILDELFNGNCTEYCIIESAKSKIDEVLIVDLREINIISFEIFKLICKNGIDYREQTGVYKIKEYIQNNFYFDTDDDFIIADGPVESPWMENLVQRYYTLNTRIGVDNYDKETRGNFYARIWEKYKYD